jgi:subtilisin family serine protease
VGLADGTAPPSRLKLAIEGGGLSITIHSNYAKNPTLQGHPGAAGAAAVGAAPFYNTPSCGVTPAVLETFSSQGGTPILFDAAGNRLTTATTRQKPDFVAPDAGNDTFLGFKDTGDQSTVAQCANNTSYPNFLGTSAAAPHAAAVAALLMQANSALTAAQIIGAMRSTALPMGSTTPDFNSGYGFIQADAAFAALPAASSTTATTSTGSGGGGGGAIDGFVLLVLAALGLGRLLLQQRRTLRSPHHHGTGDFVVPGLLVAVESDPDEAKTDDHHGEEAAERTNDGRLPV